MLYRRERRLSPWLVALLTAILVLPLGFWLGRSSAPEPTLADVLQPSVDLVREVDGTLDIVLLEYQRAQAGSQASLTAAKRATQRSQERLQEATLLRTLYPTPYQQALRTLQALEDAVAARAAVSRVEIIVDDLRRQLAALQPELNAP